MGVLRHLRLALLTPLLALVPPASADDLEPGADPVRIRVLVFDAPGPVQIRTGSGATLGIRTAGPGRLSVNGEDARSPLRVIGGAQPVAVAGESYRGELEVWRGEEGIQIVNVVGVEPYLAGTLMKEVYPYWDGDTLRAQAVVARTYALHQLAKGARKPWDLRAGTRSQVYGGLAAEHPAAWEAVRETRGEVLTYAGQPILAVYHSASGGRTASAEEVWGRPVPYLVSVPVKGERSPDQRWREPVSRSTVQQALGELGVSVGKILGLEVTGRSRSGRAQAVRIKGDGGEARVRARDLRSALGVNRIRSTRFEIRARKADFLFEGSGWGHGVGMSQWGAEAMAKSGASYREILGRFYPGTSLEQLGAGSALPAAGVE